jgi:NTE family protein
MVNPIATPFLGNDDSRGTLGKALGTLGVGIGREVLNFYRGMVQKNGDNWPRFNMLMHGVHALIDQEYSGDINIVPSFRWYNPAKILSHLSHDELLELMRGGERSCYPTVEAIRICTRISRTMEELLQRFEFGDLRPDDADYHRPRSSRRRPTATRADRDALQERRAGELPPGKTPGKKGGKAGKRSPRRKAPRRKAGASKSGAAAGRAA